MNFKFKVLLALLAGVILFYAACRKDSNTRIIPAGIDTMRAVTNQIALNLAQTVGGTYGGVNIKNGLLLPEFTSRFHSKPNVSGLFDLCTFYPDTIVNYSTNIGDTIKSQSSGLFKFYFSCDTVKAPRVNGYYVFSFLHGYAAYDSLATIGLAPKGAFVYNVKAFYEAKALDTLNTTLAINGSTSKLITVSGSIKSFVDTTATQKTVTSSSLHAYYALKDVVVDLTNNGDFTGGTATFGAIGNINNIKWYYTGTITFLGNHKASIVINNKTYNVTLLK